MEWMSFVIKVITAAFRRRWGFAVFYNFILSVFLLESVRLEASLEGSPHSGCNSSAGSEVLLTRILSLQQTSTITPKHPGGRPALRHQGRAVVNHHSLNTFSSHPCWGCCSGRAIWMAAMMPIGLVPAPEPVCSVSDLRSKPPLGSSLGHRQLSLNWDVNNVEHHWRSSSSRPQVMSLLIFWHREEKKTNHSNLSSIDVVLLICNNICSLVCVSIHLVPDIFSYLSLWVWEHVPPSLEEVNIIFSIQLLLSSDHKSQTTPLSRL